MYRLSKDFTDTIYRASSEALLITHGKSFGRVWKNINLSIVKKIFIPFNPNNLHWVLIYINIEKEGSYLIDPINETNELYRDLAMVHIVVRKKVMKSPIEAIDHALQRDSRSCGVYVCYYAKEIVKDE